MSNTWNWIWGHAGTLTKPLVSRCLSWLQALIAFLRWQSLLSFFFHAKLSPFWSHFRFLEVASIFSHSAVVSRRPEAASFGGSRRPNQTCWYYTRFLFSGRMSDFCKNAYRTPDLRDSSQWQSVETLLDMQKDIFWICCSDYLVLQRGEPRDVLMDVQGWDSCKTWGHIRGGGRRAERDLQVSGQNLINTFTPHENSPFLKMPK